MKYTPGPWKYIPGIVKHYVESENGDLRIGIQEMDLLDGHSVPAEANARLIAAAPDLLEAAKLALEKCPFPVGAMKAKEALKNAIAKTEVTI